MLTLLCLCMHVMLKYLFVYTCVDMIFCLCLQAWAVEHLKKLYVWKVNPEYDRRDSRAGRFKLSRGNADPAHYRSLIDLTVNDDIIWRPYEDT